MPAIGLANAAAAGTAGGRTNLVASRKALSAGVCRGPPPVSRPVPGRGSSARAAGGTRLAVRRWSTTLQPAGSRCGIAAHASPGDGIDGVEPAAPTGLLWADADDIDFDIDFDVAVDAPGLDQTAAAAADARAQHDVANGVPAATSLAANGWAAAAAAPGPSSSGASTGEPSTVSGHPAGASSSAPPSGRAATSRRAALLRSARSDLTQSSHRARLLATATWQDADLCLKIISDKGHMTAELVAAAWGHLHSTLLPATDMRDPGVRQLLHSFLYRLRHLTLVHGHSMPAAGLAATLPALAVWRSAKLPLREVLWGRLLQVAHSATPLQLALCLDGAGRFGCCPPTADVEAVLAAAAPQLQSASAEECALLLHGLSQLQPGGGLPGQAPADRRQLDTCTGALAAQLAAGAEQASAASLVLAAYALGQLQEAVDEAAPLPQPPLAAEADVERVYSALEGRMSELSGAQLAALLAALGPLQLEPWPEWLDACARWLERRAFSAPAQLLAQALAALPQLQWRPSPDWLHQLLQALPAGLRECSPEQLAALPVHVVRLQLAPPRAWMDAYYRGSCKALAAAPQHLLPQAATAAAALSASVGAREGWMRSERAWLRCLNDACLPQLPGSCRQRGSGQARQGRRLTLEEVGALLRALQLLDWEPSEAWCQQLLLHGGWQGAEAAAAAALLQCVPPPPPRPAPAPAATPPPPAAAAAVAAAGCMDCGVSLEPAQPSTLADVGSRGAGPPAQPRAAVRPHPPQPAGRAAAAALLLPNLSLYTAPLPFRVSTVVRGKCQVSGLVHA